MSKPGKVKPRLGRGLSSLLALADEEAEDGVGPLGLGPAFGSEGVVPGVVEGAVIVDLPLDSIQANPHQPRQDFDETRLHELAASLKATGLIQPIIVRRVEGRYQLIAGERRWHAARIANLTSIPAIIREVDEYSQAQMALIENIQREDLNAIDRANAYQSLLHLLGLTHGELATRLGEDRTAITHFLRLLELPAIIQDWIRQNRLSLGHGKILASITDPPEQMRLARLTQERALSVRQLEDMVATPPPEAVTQQPKRASSGSAAHLKELEKSISRHLNARVQVKWSSRTGKGKLIIHYDLDEFDALRERLGVASEE